jgi:hypothetical protein
MTVKEGDLIHMLTLTPVLLSKYSYLKQKEKKEKERVVLEPGQQQ